MRKKAENIISACVIIGFSLIWCGACVASFYWNIFILCLILGVMVIAGSLIYGRINQLHERRLGLEAVEQRRKQEEGIEEIVAIVQEPFPRLPQISRIYGLLLIAFALYFTVDTILNGIPILKNQSYMSVGTRQLETWSSVTFLAMVYLSGYMLLGGKFSKDSQKNKVIYVSLLPFVRGMVLFFGYACIFFGLCSASTLYRNESAKPMTFSMLLFGIFTAIYFNVPSVKKVFKRK